jgi:hypothetical protein
MSSMFRVKMLIGLAGVFAVLSLSATPAFAEWQAKGQSKGVVKIIKSGEFVDGEGASAGIVTCPKEEIKAEWSIQTKGPITEHEKQGKQVQTKTGPHLWIKVLNWGAHCIAKISGIESAAEVKPCELQLVQLRGEFTATGGVGSECIIKASVCELKIPQAEETMPGSNTGKNVGLQSITLTNEITNIGTNQIDKANVNGIRAVSNGGLCPLITNETSKLKGLEFQIENVAAI